MSKNWVETEQGRSESSERPSFKKIKRAVRSENFPHSQIEWKGYRDDACVASAEDVLIATRMLARSYPDPDLSYVVSDAQSALTTALFIKFTGKPYQFVGNDDIPAREAHDKAWEMVKKFDKAVERTVARLLPQPPIAEQTP